MEPAEGAVKSKRQASAKGPPAPPRPKPIEVHRYRAVLELTARQRVELEVSAATPEAAAQLVKERAESIILEPNKAVLERKLSRPKRV